MKHGLVFGITTGTTVLNEVLKQYLEHDLVFGLGTGKTVLNEVLKQYLEHDLVFGLSTGTTGLYVQQSHIRFIFGITNTVSLLLFLGEIN
jgi:hypothetical protein